MVEIALLLLIVFSIGAVQTHRLRHSIIYLGIFSLCISFVYLIYNAPDVALAEAIFSNLSLNEIFEHHQYSLIIESDLEDDELTIYAHSENFKLDSLEAFLKSEYQKPYILKKIQEAIVE